MSVAALPHANLLSPLPVTFSNMVKLQLPLCFKNFSGFHHPQDETKICQERFLAALAAFKFGAETEWNPKVEPSVLYNCKNTNSYLKILCENKHSIKYK